ncbi:hypothetical protein HYH03_008176 [Edaphochlamys debaryana]|uniref:Guanylate cyclase domain-containing protein n=1 Tax=Edaphochlamys debaryana TaxID=47281 RepID=A0A836BZ74_9CHLO|nr:hypothetical protein HYH03_008176 [Edaphochlamys debaryana]|eukprot:KAG2493662.1 hypothetical protein HYH03_008176 [Edaphochlamys debaryana]
MQLLLLALASLALQSATAHGSAGRDRVGRTLLQGDSHGFDVHGLVTRYNLNADAEKELQAWAASHVCETEVPVSVQLDVLYSSLAYSEVAAAAPASTDVHLVPSGPSSSVTGPSLYRSSNNYSGAGDMWLADSSTGPCQGASCSSSGITFDASGGVVVAGGQSLDDVQGLPKELNPSSRPPNMLLGPAELARPQLLLYYRADVFAARGYLVPATWADLLEWARGANGTRHEGQEYWALCLDVGKDGGGCKSSYLVMAIMASLVQAATPQGAFFDTNVFNNANMSRLVPLVGTAAFEEALGLASQLLAYSYPVTGDGAYPCLPYDKPFSEGKCLATVNFDQMRASPLPPDSAGSLLPTGDTIAAKLLNTSRGALPPDALGVAPLPGSERILERRGGGMAECGRATCPNAVQATCGNATHPRACLVNRAPLLASLAYDDFPSPNVSAVVQVRLALLGLSLAVATRRWPEALANTLLNKQGYQGAAARRSALEAVLGGLGPWGEAAGAPLRRLLQFSGPSAPSASGAPNTVATWTSVEPLVRVGLGYSRVEVARYLSAYWASLLGPDGSHVASLGPHRNVVQELGLRGSSYFTAVYGEALARVLAGAAPSAASRQAAADTERLARLVATNLTRLLYKYCDEIGWTGIEGPRGLPPDSGSGDGGLSPGELAAAIVVPIVAAALLLLGLWGLVVAGQRRRLGLSALWGTVAPPGANPRTTLILTDIQNSTVLWETLDPGVMDRAIKCHHEVLRGLLPKHRGYESATEGDAFILAFHTAEDAAHYAVDAQVLLAEAPWPEEMLSHPDCEVVWVAPQRNDPTASLSYISKELLSVITRAVQTGVAPGGGLQQDPGDVSSSVASSMARSSRVGTWVRRIAFTMGRTASGSSGTDGALTGTAAAAAGPGGDAAAAAGGWKRGPSRFAVDSATATVRGSGGGANGERISGGGAAAADLELGGAATATFPGLSPASPGAGVGPGGLEKIDSRRSQGYSGYGKDIDKGFRLTQAHSFGAAKPKPVKSSSGKGLTGAITAGITGGINAGISAGIGVGLGGWRVARAALSLASPDAAPRGASSGGNDVSGKSPSQTAGGGGWGVSLDRVLASRNVTVNVANGEPVIKSPSDVRSYMVESENDLPDPRDVDLHVHAAAGRPGRISFAAMMSANHFSAAAAAAAGGDQGDGAAAAPGPALYLGTMAVATLTEALRKGWRMVPMGGLEGPAGSTGGAGSAGASPMSHGGLAATSSAASAASPGGAVALGGEGDKDGSTGPSEQLLCFRGMRVRMGLHTGAALNEVAVNKATGRMQYSGGFMTAAKGVCDAAHGGQVVMSPATFRQLPPGCMARSAFIMHMGEHVLEEGEEPDAMYQLLPYCLSCRLPFFEPLRTHAYLSLGLPDAPVGRVTVAFMYVIGAQGLLAWNPTVASTAMSIFHDTVAQQLNAADGYVVELVDGLCLAAFRSPADALLWSLRCGRALLQAPWSDELLEHELCEEVSVPLQHEYLVGPPPDAHAHAHAHPHSSLNPIAASALANQGSRSGLQHSVTGPLPGSASGKEGPQGSGASLTMLNRASAIRFKTLMRGLRLKVGLDVGFVSDSINATTGRMAYRGRPMNRAARIASKALAGQVHCSSGVWHAAADRLAVVARAGGEDAVTASSLGLHSLKGVMEKIEVFSVSYKGSVLSPEEAAVLGKRGPRTSYGSSATHGSASLTLGGASATVERSRTSLLSNITAAVAAATSGRLSPSQRTSAPVPFAQRSLTCSAADADSPLPVPEEAQLSPRLNGTASIGGLALSASPSPRGGAPPETLVLHSNPLHDNGVASSPLPSKPPMLPPPPQLVLPPRVSGAGAGAAAGSRPASSARANSRGGGFAAVVAAANAKSRASFDGASTPLGGPGTGVRRASDKGSGSGGGVSVSSSGGVGMALPSPGGRPEVGVIMEQVEGSGASAGSAGGLDLPASFLAGAANAFAAPGSGPQPGPR